jgi:ABC-type branched-subunit amino acid transport system ATPase component
MSEKALLETVDLTVNFGSLIAVNRVNIKIPDKGFLTIIGPNGSGKTTLINAITGKVIPSYGKVFFNGIDITKYPPHRRVKMGIGRIFQIESLFLNLSVFDNIALSVCSRLFAKNVIEFLKFAKTDKRVNEEVESILDIIGLTSYSHKPVKSLPHGIKRLVEIAMLLAQRPRILLLDEPLAGLSSSECEELMELIDKKLRGNYALLLIEHKIDMISKYVDEVCVMHQGKIIAQGSYKGIIDNPLVQKVYLGEEL